MGAQVGVRSILRAPTWIIKAIFGLVFLYISLKFILMAFWDKNLEVDKFDRKRVMFGA